MSAEKHGFLSVVYDAALGSLKGHTNSFIKEELLSETDFGKQVLKTMGELAWLEFRGRDVSSSRDHLWSALRLKYREKAQDAKVRAFEAAVDTLNAVASAIGRALRAAASGAIGVTT